MRHVGIYGRYGRGASRLTVLGGVSRVTHDTARRVTDGLGSSLAQAGYDSGSLFSRVEYGHAFALGMGVSVEPQAGFQSSSDRRPSGPRGIRAIAG